jgi:hypothetical protein
MRAALLAAVLSTACGHGTVLDAEDLQPLEGVTVWAVGACSGTPCASPTDAVQLTDADGTYAFDPYADTPLLIEPAAGREALQLLYLRAGYRTVSHFFSPALVAEEIEGRTVSEVPRTFLVPADQDLDSDDDGLPDLEEARYGTDPFLADTDGDHIPDGVEVHGDAWVDYASLGADPTVPDIFVEMDYTPWVSSTGIDVLDGPWQSAVDEVVDAFAKEGIALHLLVDDAITEVHAQVLCAYTSPWPEVDLLKETYFDDNRRKYFHYAIFARQYCNSDGLTGSSGLSRGRPGVDFIVTLGTKFEGLGEAPDPADYSGGATSRQFAADHAHWAEQVRINQSGTIMHELGHNLGLGHSGQQSTPTTNPGYLSVMSYTYQREGIEKDGRRIIDFSQFPVTIDESELDEAVGLATPANAAYLDQLGHYTLNLVQGTGDRFQDDLCGGAAGLRATGPVDWDRNCAIRGGPREIDIAEQNVIRPEITTWRDWDHLDYSGGPGGMGDTLVMARMLAPEVDEPCE